jgi:myo-inositol-1(or 4)-monophosphatase
MGGCHATGSRYLCCDGTVTENDADPVLLRSVAERLATEAADFVRRRREEVFGDPQPNAGSAVRAKSTPTDPVTVVDTESERLLRVRLAELRPANTFSARRKAARPVVPTV